MYLTTETNGLWHSMNVNAGNPEFTLETSYPFRQPERVFYDPYNTSELWVSSFGAGMMVASENPSGVAEKTGRTPDGFLLEQNFPNPFNPSTVVSGRLTVDSRIRLVIYDLLGREVAELADGRYPAGRFSFTFDGTGLSSGVYFCRLSTGSFTAIRKMALVR